MWRALSLLFFVGLGLNSGFAADSLLEVYQRALENDPTFRAAQASLRAGLEEEQKGLSLLLPKVNANASFGLNQNQTRGQFPAGGFLFPSNTDIGSETKTWGISLSQPIFDLAAWFRFRRGQALSEQAKARFSAEAQALILRVAEAYLKILKARADLKASRAQETALARQLEQAKERFEVGLAAITDMREAEAAYDLAVAQRLADEGALKVAKEKLSILTGVRHEEVLELAQEYPVTPPDPQEAEKWVEFARQNNYEIKAADLSRSASLNSAKAARAEHLPKITANLNYSETRSDNDFHNLTPAGANSRYFNFPRNANQGSLSLNLELPLFAGGAISATRRQAQAEYEKSEEEYLAAVRNTEQNTRAEYINVVTQIARTQATHKAVISAKASLQATTAGYEVGTRNLVDVLAALRTLYSAIRDHENARLDYALASLRLKYLAGILSPQDLADLNRFLGRAEDLTSMAQDR
jgi:outer membrane protein